MRVLLLMILWGLPCIILGQSANFEDDFSDQDISDWSGDTGNFIFTEESGNTLLQQNAPGAGVSYLSIPSTNTIGYWEFFVRFDGFGPSNGNKAEIYLMSDNQDLTSSLNGYKLRGGENGSADVFRLFRITSGSEATEVLTGTTDISSGGDYRVKVTRDASGNWTLEVAEGYAGVLSVEDTGADNTYTSTSYFGFKNTYSSTRSDLFYYDFKIDIPPVEVTSVSLVSDIEIDVIFSRDIDFSSVQTSDFVLNPGGITPQSVSQQSGDTTRITFSSAISSGPNSLTISGIEDNANETTLADTTFSFFVYDGYQTGDVIVNEFMKDPPPGTAEYLELRNTSSRFLNLRNWQLGDNNSLSTISFSNFTLQPDSFVVVSSDTSALNTYYGDAVYLQASLPAFNNGGDQIRLFDESGSLIDSLQYDDDWGGEDVSLERRSSTVSSVYKENWGDSPSADFGTPGFPNQVQPDNTPPFISSLEVEDSQTLLLVISERAEASSAQDLNNYSLSQNPKAGVVTPPIPGISSIQQIAPDSLRISLDTELQEYDGSWTLAVSNLTDIFGNSTDRETDFNYYVIFSAEPNQVVINEFMYDPGDGFSEFVELYNHSDSSFNLQNWTFSDNTGDDEVLTTNSFVLPAGKYVVLAPDSLLAVSFPNISLIDMGSRFSSLNNSSDAIVIKNQNGLVIDSLSYEDNWGGEEISLERRTETVTGIYRENWGDSPSENMATPGRENEIPADSSPPQINDVFLTSEDAIRVIYSERIIAQAATDTENYDLSAESSFTGAVPGIQSAILFPPDTVLLQFDNVLESDPSGTNYQLDISGQSDVFGNVSSSLSSSFFLIEYAHPDSGAVAISEFMYDPAEGFSEFLELVNRTDSAFNLKQWTFNDNTGNRRRISDTTYTFPPNSYLVLTPDSTLLESYPGIPALVIGSRFSSLNNSTDAIVIRDASGTLLDSLTYTSSWGGDEVSVERRSFGFAATFKENWGTSPAVDGATPGLPNQIPEDEKPPEIQSLSVVNDSTLQLIFNERVQPVPATNPENYDFSAVSNATGNSVSPDSFNYLAPDTVIISFPAKIPKEETGTTYQLRVGNQMDVFGNTSGDLVAEFFLIDLAEAGRGDVVVNEFLYEPEEDYTEFIELYNPTNKNYDLRNWTVNDNTGNRREMTSSGLELTLNSYLILAPDSSFLELFPNRPTIILGSRFPSLNNSTDAIVIRNAAGELIDSLTYTSDWGGEGVSLERRSPDFPSIYKENWGDSPAEVKATPGLANEIEQDNEAPVLESAFITSADSIRMIFDERIDSALATDISNYSISSPLSIAEVANYGGNLVTLVLSTSLSSGDSFTISVQNQQDIFGNAMTSASADLEYTVFSPVTRRDVIINEILYRRASAESAEFVELYNRTGNNFNLTGWTFSDATGSATIPEGTIIKSNEYVVLTDSEDFATGSGSALAKAIANGKVVYLSGFPSLNDDEDAVVIKDENGMIVDSLFYKETWGGNEPGISLERKDPESASNDAGNWASNTSESGSSAGAQSSIYQPDQTPPEIVFAKLQTDGKIYVAFSEFVRSSGTGPITVNDEPATITEYNEENANILIIGDVAYPTGEPLTVAFGQATDFRGNTSGELAIEVSQPLSKGNVVINEILFDPLANSDDNLPDQTEYVEFYNRANYAVSLEGFFIHDKPDENNEIRSVHPFSSEFRWIPAGGTVVFYAEDQTPVFSESRLAEYFELEGEGELFFIRADRTNLSLASSGDAIYLADSTGTTIDSVFYDESWHNPNLYDVDGVALERIDPVGPSNDATNWSSSTAVSGGTPGQQNSIFQQAGAGPDDAGITFSPNPFSPDDDGFEDNLFINYKLEEPDYLLRVRIFDRYGREVRKLADGKQAGFEGSLIWDGLKDNGSKNRVGIYIVLFEAYNSAEGKNKTFKKTVVLAKKF
ncbi:lamin tail domain-containing protein [Gracilimonas sediminicola]|uniref:Lamin tail domain-containing protein n=1 Tax=Gracilimonas sediminicola TaxID=2952158 RepID=A0A9X2L1W7_9BACT|nr:lamin tail domain-containing protein [Gracilimonas sediminicola]MCP9290813.1 lamin tail domain-containing protein [Gracilimonas sediminicola]